jgi:hypothetical protein
MVTKIIMAETSCAMKAIRAKLSHDFFSIRSFLYEAVAKEIVEMIEAIKASKTKKCPICPGNKCSPSNYIQCNY